MRERSAAATELLLIGTRYRFPVRLSTMSKYSSGVPSGNSESILGILAVFRSGLQRDHAVSGGGTGLELWQQINMAGDPKHSDSYVLSKYVPGLDKHTVISRPTSQLTACGLEQKELPSMHLEGLWSHKRRRGDDSKTIGGYHRQPPPFMNHAPCYPIQRIRICEGNFVLGTLIEEYLSMAAEDIIEF